MSFYMFDNYLSLLVVISLNTILIVSVESELKLVNVIFRHGDRTPVNKHEMFPNDPHLNNSFFPMGHGELTNQGKKREYELGQALRNKYKDFLGDLYLPKLVVAHTSDTDRTKMSLQLVLAALFPPTDTQRWNADLNWQPIPITYVPRVVDNFFLGVECPQHVNEYNRILNEPEMKKKISQFKNVKNKLTELTGRMIRTILNNMIAAKDPNPPNTKIYLYSGHENNIVNLLQIFGLYETHLPAFSSALLTELHEINQEYYVKLLYYRGIPPIFEQLQIPGYDVLFPFDNFLDLIEDLFPLKDEIICDKRQTPNFAHIKYSTDLQKSIYNLIKTSAIDGNA